MYFIYNSNWSVSGFLLAPSSFLPLSLCQFVASCFSCLRFSPFFIHFSSFRPVARAEWNRLQLRWQIAALYKCDSWTACSQLHWVERARNGEGGKGVAGWLCGVTGIGFILGLPLLCHCQSTFNVTRHQTWRSAAATCTVPLASAVNHFGYPHCQHTHTHTHTHVLEAWKKLTLARHTNWQPLLGDSAQSLCISSFRSPSPLSPTFSYSFYIPPSPPFHCSRLSCIHVGSQGWHNGKWLCCMPRKLSKSSKFTRYGNASCYTLWHLVLPLCVCVCVCCSLAAGQSKKLTLSPPFAICYTRSLLLNWLCPLSSCLPFPPSSPPPLLGTYCITCVRSNCSQCKKLSKRSRQLTF